jgi:hypothetical protein
MSTKKWTVTMLSVAPSADGLSDVVINVYWLCSAIDADKTYNTNGCTQVPNPDPDNFIPFSSLTQDQVLQWVFSTLGPVQVSEIEASADKGLQDLINPPIIYPPLPWAPAVTQ